MTSCASYTCKCRRFKSHLRLTRNEPQVQPSKLDRAQGLKTTRSRPEVLKSPARQGKGRRIHRPRSDLQIHLKVMKAENPERTGFEQRDRFEFLDDGSLLTPQTAVYQAGVG